VTDLLKPEDVVSDPGSMRLHPSSSAPSSVLPSPPRRGRAAARAVASGALALAALVGLAPPAGAASKVPPEQYVERICALADSINTRAEAFTGALQQAGQAFQATPNQVTATAVRAALAAVIRQTAGDVDELLAAATAAGAPDVKKGSKFAQAVRTQMQDASAVLHQVATDAEQIGVDSTTRFAQDFQAVIDRIEREQKRSIKAAARLAVFRDAPRSLRRLVRFLTTDATTCPAR
jgi:hypothetical protein